VRSKTLFASTRATIVRELGSEKFTDSVFAVEEEEVLSESEWRERDADKKATRGGEDEDEKRREQVMGEQERELHRLNKEESQERSMSHRRDIGIGGSVGGKRPGVPMNVGDGVVDALLEIRNEEGNVVVLVSIQSVYAGAAKANSTQDYRRAHRVLCPLFKANQHLSGAATRADLRHETPVHVLSISQHPGARLYLYLSAQIFHQGTHAQR
jgi:twinfilin-like protein